MTNVIRIESFNELQDRIFEDSWNDELGRFRSRNAFRGLSDDSYQLETTLMRLGGSYAGLERHLLRNFSKYAHGAAIENESVWNWLSLAQHHGLPTRLMDWTYSPYVALHFATSNLERFDSDGAIWAVNYVKAHSLLPPKLHEELESEGANVFTVKMLSETINSLKDLDQLSKSDFVIFFEPPSIDERIVNQFAFFSIFSNAQARLDEWLLKHPECWRKLIIPAKLKWEIRDKLDQANITERVLFPGLDGLSSWLKRQYSPKI